MENGCFRKSPAQSVNAVIAQGQKKSQAAFDLCPDLPGKILLKKGCKFLTHCRCLLSGFFGIPKHRSWK
jgi:hypothetical protein